MSSMVFRIIIIFRMLTMMTSSHWPPWMFIIFRIFAKTISMVFRIFIIFIIFRIFARMISMVFRIFIIFIIFRIFTKMTSMMKLSKSFLVTIQWINLRILRESTVSRIVFWLKIDFNKKFFEQILKWKFGCKLQTKV